MCDNARALAQGYLLPRAGEDYLEERFDREIMTRMGRVGLLGPTIPQVSARLAPRVALIFRTLGRPLLLFTKFQAAWLSP